MLALDEAAHELANELVADSRYHQPENYQRQVNALAQLLQSDFKLEGGGQRLSRAERDFQKHEQDWKKFEQLAFGAEVDQLHRDARRYDKGFNQLAFAQSYKQDIKLYEKKYGGLLRRLYSLPIDRYHIPLPGGATTSLNRLADGYDKAMAAALGTETVKAITDKKVGDGFDRLSEARRLMAAEHLTPVMKALERSYRGQGLRGDELKALLADDRHDLLDWLTDIHIRRDYNKYEAARSGYAMRLEKLATAGHNTGALALWLAGVKYRLRGRLLRRRFRPSRTF
jgi:hypothetical protein